MGTFKSCDYNKKDLNFNIFHLYKSDQSRDKVWKEFVSTSQNLRNLECCFFSLVLSLYFWMQILTYIRIYIHAYVVICVIGSTLTQIILENSQDMFHYFYYYLHYSLKKKHFRPKRHFLSSPKECFVNLTQINTLVNLASQLFHSDTFFNQ